MTRDSNPTPDWLRRARDAWAHRGQTRPSFAIEPKPGQVSVWDFPRPPKVVDCPFTVTVKIDESVVADTRRARMVLETAHPPTYYLPPSDVEFGHLRAAGLGSICEWKGRADVFDVLRVGRVVSRAAWRYPKPFAEYAQLAGWIGFYPTGLDCRVDGQPVRPQPGGFYAGWITPDLAGPFKGDPGTGGW